MTRVRYARGDFFSLFVRKARGFAGVWKWFGGYLIPQVGGKMLAVGVYQVIRFRQFIATVVTNLVDPL